MNLIEMDAAIRTMMHDGPERRKLLTALGDLSEGLNNTLGFLLALSGYHYDADIEAWRQEPPPKRQINPR